MRFNFEDCIFDCDTRQLVRHGDVAPLSPKAFLLLELLLRARPRAVSKNEIRKHLWPQTFVTEANIANLVVEVRAALGDDARKPRILRTVHGYGYAFAALARESEPEPPAPQIPLFCRLVWGRREIPLDPGENLIGRDPGSAVCIDHVTVSRRHARIVVDGSGATIEDLASKNGTLVGEERVSKPRRLSDGDRLRVGPALMRVRVTPASDSTRSAAVGPKRRGSKRS